MYVFVDISSQVQKKLGLYVGQDCFQGWFIAYWEWRLRINTWFFDLLWPCWVWGLSYPKLLVKLLLFALCWRKIRGSCASDRACQTAQTLACLCQVPPCPQGPQGWSGMSTWGCTHVRLCFCWVTLSLGESTVFILCSKSNLFFIQKRDLIPPVRVVFCEWNSEK